jgi:predicted NAD-dependent protein-ADP-ribosyltransferase YbiA (DUF1768 family)
MKACLFEKFSQNVKLKEELHRTFDAILVESSPYDKIWRICINEINAKIKSKRGEIY